MIVSMAVTSFTNHAIAGLIVGGVGRNTLEPNQVNTNIVAECHLVLGDNKIFHVAIENERFTAAQFQVV